MNVRIERILPILFLPLLLCSCSTRTDSNTSANSPSSSTQTDSSAPAPSAATQPPKYHATLTVPAHVKALANTPITVKITDTSTGRPVVGGRTVVSLSMPSMSGMPLNMVRMTERQPGVYTGTGTFTMSGAWQASATVLDAQGREWAQTFPVTVK